MLWCRVCGGSKAVMDRMIPNKSQVIMIITCYSSQPNFAFECGQISILQCFLCREQFSRHILSAFSATCRHLVLTVFTWQQVEHSVTKSHFFAPCVNWYMLGLVGGGGGVDQLHSAILF